MLDSSSRIIRSELLLTASRFQVQRATQTLEDGSEHSREVIQHPGAVVILPILDDGRVCLIRNYRIAIDQELVELPAGTLEPPEPPIDTAKRELIEETGYRCTHIEPLGDFYMSPGILNERMYAFVARGLTAGQQALETGEQIETFMVSMEEVNSMISSGEIRDSKTLSTLLLYTQSISA